MRFFSLILVFFLFESCQQKSYIYIVRHAEKSTDPPADVYLSQAGRQRAISLKNYLQHKNLYYIFSTRYNRTRETATPISSESGAPINFYSNDTLGKFVKSILKLKKNMLIVGHSNTVLTILDSMHVPHTIKEIPDNDYDNMFIVTQKKGKITGLKETTYGRRSPEGAGNANASMKMK